MDLQLTDRVYIVTGGARGLGRASADVLVAEGARLVLSGRSQESLDGAVASLNDAAGRDAAVGVAVDNSDREAPTARRGRPRRPARRRSRARARGPLP